ncbi:MAG TPA: VOC family protein [Prosthecobacter sp.]|nr:VOC family protein [Prosthecobacter sp.]
MEPRISLLTLGVSDLARSVRFYRDGLGFPTKFEEGGPVAFFSNGGTRLALYPLEHLAEDIGAGVPAEFYPFCGITIAHNTRTKAEVAQVLAQAETAGGKIVKPAQDLSWGGHGGYFTDPDGYHWEVAWNPFFPFAEDGSVIVDG